MIATKTPPSKPKGWQEAFAFWLDLIEHDDSDTRLRMSARQAINTVAVYLDDQAIVHEGPSFEEAESDNFGRGMDSVYWDVD